MRLSEQNIEISVALIGNAKSGKSALFDTIVADGAREPKGEVIVGRCNYNGYTLCFYELPGLYAISPTTSEGLFVRNNMLEHKPDVVLNVVCSTNLEEQLYLTTELIDMSHNIVVALNNHYAIVLLLLCSPNTKTCKGCSDCRY